MSVYGSGVANTGGLLADTPATDKWRQQMQAAAQRVREKYAHGGAAGAVLVDVDKWWKVATQFATEAPTARSMPAGDVKAAQTNALNLLELRAALRLRDPHSELSSAELAHAVAVMVAPIDWLVTAGAPILETAEKPASILKTLAWGGLAIGVLYGASKFLGSVSQVKRDFVGDRPLVPNHLVRNPPAWAVDAELYETARVAVEESEIPYENPQAVTVHVYKQLGGRVS